MTDTTEEPRTPKRDTRTMGELTSAEQDKVIAEAIRKLKAEMENNPALETALREPITLR